MPRHQHEALVLKTANYTATLADTIISCSGTFTVTLPTAVGCAGRQYVIKNTDTGVITVDANSTETITLAVRSVTATASCVGQINTREDQ